MGNNTNVDKECWIKLGLTEIRVVLAKGNWYTQVLVKTNLSTYDEQY